MSDNNIKIVMKDDVHKEISTLMRCNDELNNGNEIGAWLLGEWTVKDGEYKLILDSFHIPEQTVNSTEVEISEDSMISTLDEIGIENSGKIKAHWHIHPFNKGKTTWSTQDETKIKEFMGEGKDIKFFVFLLSSLDTIKARLEVFLEVKNPIDQSVSIERRFLDDLDVYRESDLDSEKILEKLKKRIDDKVKVEVVKGTEKGYNSIKSLDSIGVGQSRNKMLYHFVQTKKDITLIIDKTFWNFIPETEDLKNSYHVNSSNGHFLEFTYSFDNKKDKKQYLEYLKKILSTYFETLEEVEYENFRLSKLQDVSLEEKQAIDYEYGIDSYF